MKRLALLITPFLLLVIFIISLNTYLNNSLIKFFKEKDLSTIKTTYAESSRDKGFYIKNLISDNNLLLMGSSELGSDVPENPTKFFPFNDATYEAIPFGRAHVQSLQHSNIIGSFDNLSPNSKLALVVSIQWFYESSGIDPTSFQANFSPVQFYEFLDNPKISKKNKQYFCNRVYSLLEGSDIFASERTYAKLYLLEGKSKLVSYILKPYFICHENIVSMKDKVDAYKTLKELPNSNNNSNEIKSINWNEAYKKATEEGKEAVGNTPYYLKKDYYEKYIKGQEDAVRSGLDKASLLDSKELNDFKFLLSVYKDLGVKPYIILMSTNGFFYDNTGLTKERRANFYNHVEKIAEDEGFSVLNLKDKEHEPYYFKDVMHLGWKGWLNVNEEIYKHFNKQ